MWRAVPTLRRAGVLACVQTQRTGLRACHEKQRDQPGVQSTLLALVAAAVAGLPGWQARCEQEPADTERDTGATNASAKWRVYTDVGRDRVNQARKAFGARPTPTKLTACCRESWTRRSGICGRPCARRAVPSTAKTRTSLLR